MAHAATETDPHTIHLPAPRPLAPGLPHAAPRRRTGCPAYGTEPLGGAELLALLEAAFDVQRPGCWGRSAPSARSWHEVDVYVVTPDAVVRYDARLQQAQAVQAAEPRALAALAAGAPLTLVYVADLDARERRHEEEHGVAAGGDAGAIVENVYRYCDRAGLATAVRGRIDRAGLARALGLAPTQRIVLAQGVGHPATANPH